MIQTRIATKEDLPTLAELRLQFRLEDRASESHDSETHDSQTYDRQEFMERCLAFLENGLTSGSWAYWIAESDGKIVATAFVNRVAKTPSLDNTSTHWGYLTNVYTTPEYRNQGIGERLITSVTNWAKSQNQELLIVWPSDRSRGFYQRLGFSDKNDIMENLLS